jgi:hypothetical protein
MEVRYAEEADFCWRSICSRSISLQLQQISCRDAAHITEAAIEIRDKPNIAQSPLTGLPYLAQFRGIR